MRDLNDAELLSAYARQHSEEAFSVLVERYVALVHSAAMRQVQNQHLAQEVTQAVFIILAQKAGGLNQRTVISGWLCRTAHFVARNAMKAEFRRLQREQEAHMQSTLNESDAEAWAQLSPLLDEGVAQLNELDRNAVVLRFYQQKPLAEVGGLLGIDADAAQKRVARAVDKLRKFFGKRGVALSAGVIIGVISANSIQAAPLGLTASSVAAAQGAGVSTSTTTLVKGGLKLMAKAKLKIGLAFSAALMFAVGTTTLAIKSKTPDPSAMDIARKSEEKYASLSSYSDDGTVRTSGSGPMTTTRFNIRLQRPNLYRVDWNSDDGFYKAKGAVWSAGAGDFYRMDRAATEKTNPPEKMRDRKIALDMAGGVSSGVSSGIPVIFFRENSGDYLTIAASGKFPVVKEADDKVGEFDCYVLSGSIAPIKLPKNTGSTGRSTFKLWIGREDYLIHKEENTIEMPTLPEMKLSDELVKRALAEKNIAATPEAMAAKRAEMEQETKREMRLIQAGKFVFTQIHEHITVNETYSAADFRQ